MWQMIWLISLSLKLETLITSQVSYLKQKEGKRIHRAYNTMLTSLPIPLPDL